MQAVAIINLVDAYEIWLKLRPISINTYRGKVLQNLASSLPKFLQVLAIKSGYKSLLV